MVEKATYSCGRTAPPSLEVCNLCPFRSGCLAPGRTGRTIGGGHRVIKPEEKNPQGSNSSGGRKR